jgi:hypothetical protein
MGAASRAIALDDRYAAAMESQRLASRRRTMPSGRAARQQRSILPSATLGLKLAAAILAGATITLLVWPRDGGFVAPRSLESDRFAATFGTYRQESKRPESNRQDSYRQESTVYRRAGDASQHSVRLGEAASVDSELERDVPSNFPRRVQTIRFAPPQRLAALSPPALAPAAPLTIDKPWADRPPAALGVNPLAGKQLRYLIGTDSSGSGRDDEVTEVSYNAGPVKRGISIAYCNLFDERNTRQYGPYLHSSDTAKQYNEGQIDPRGAGWEKNLREQYERRRKQGFEYIELDNPDAYTAKDVIGAIDLAATYGLKVIAKNPGLVPGATAYVAHPNVYGIIVEKGAGGAADMDALRRKAGKPNLPVWFVAFGGGRGWAGSVASSAKQYRHMGVTYSSSGEYGNALDVLQPSS